MKPFFSVIIPVYNVEEYISRCLESCIKQTFKEIEIIIVDDCGQDSSMKIAREYSKLDTRIKIKTNKKNLGLFLARIEGEKIALGEYVIHIDSDDFVSKDLCEKLYQKINQDYIQTKQYADICAYGITLFPKTFKKSPIASITQTLKNEDIAKQYILKSSSPPWSVCGKTFHISTIRKTHELIDQLEKPIPRLIMAEDALKFSITTICAKKSIGINTKMYYYFCSNTSITRKNDSESLKSKIKDLQNVIATLELIKKNNQLSCIHFKSLTKVQNILKSVIELEYRYQNTPFSYPKACIKSLKYHQKWQTYLRILLFTISFGKIKL